MIFCYTPLIHIASQYMFVQKQAIAKKILIARIDKLLRSKNTKIEYVILGTILIVYIHVVYNAYFIT